MSVKDCKDLPLELDSVVLAAKRGLRNIVLTNATAGSFSTIFQSGAFTLAVESDSNGGVGPSAIAFLANNAVGSQAIPLYLTGDGAAITGVLNINGVPYVPNATTITQVQAPIVQNCASGVPTTIYTSPVLPAGIYSVNTFFQMDTNNALTTFTAAEMYIQDPGVASQVGFYDPSLAQKQIGGQTTFLFRATGLNSFIIVCDGNTSDGAAYGILAGAETQYVRIA